MIAAFLSPQPRRRLASFLIHPWLWLYAFLEQQPQETTKVPWHKVHQI